MTKREIDKLKKDYKHISAVLEIVEDECAKFDTKEWNKNQQIFQTRTRLRKMKKAYGQKLIETIL